MTLVQETFTSRTLASAPTEDGLQFRLCYADHVPVSVWRVWFGETFEEVAEKARKVAAQDNHPSSDVESTIFVVEQFHGGEWDAYDPDGRDLTDLAFGGEG